MVGTVECGCLLQLDGDGHEEEEDYSDEEYEELPEEEHPERPGGTGHDQRPDGVQPAELIDDQVVRHDEHETRNEQGGHDQREDQPAAAELQPGQGVGRHRGDHQHEQHVPERSHQRVQHPAQHRVRPVQAEQGVVGGGVQRGGQQRWWDGRGLAVGLQRGGAHPQDGTEEGHEQGRQHQPEHRAAQQRAGTHPGAWAGWGDGRGHSAVLRRRRRGRSLSRRARKLMIEMMPSTTESR